MRSSRRPAVSCARLALALSVIAHVLRADEPAAPPLALRGVDPRRLSGGLFLALDSVGAFGGHPTQLRAREGVADLSKGKPPAVLDARVGPNVRLGVDPAALTPGQTSQAEPHLARSLVNPDTLLATFQEGRFASGGGATDCGYALSHDRGRTWERALIPRLTVASGGVYVRATDPVAAFGPHGDLYLNTLGSLDNAFGVADILLSRSTDDGATWAAPVVVFHQTTAQASPDKNWIAVNDYAGASTAGRLVVTWTNFTSDARGNATGNNLLAAVSDDRGATWSPPITITPTGASNQGSQPLFLPDGSLAVVYVTFATSTRFSLQCKRSLDGGRTFPAVATTAVATINEWTDPVLRTGSFLPGAAVARATGEIFACYVGLVGNTPRVFVVKSSDSGATWSAPVIASNNPAGVSVANAALTVTPDGKTVTVVFMDKRHAPDGLNFIDHYAALSFDGGATWQPNVRLSEQSSDVRFAPKTGSGYMLGDYLAITPPIADGQPAFAIWCDTRSGDGDPFVAALAPTAAPDFGAWAAARGVRPQGNVFQDDADGDGTSDYLEFLDGTDPLRKDPGENLLTRRVSSTEVDVYWTERATVQRTGAIADGVALANAANLAGPLPFGQSAAVPASLPANQLPTIAPSVGLGWRGVRTTLAAGTALGAARAVKFSAGLPVVASTQATALGTDARLINLSTRGQVRTGASELIVGFVIDGTKNILVRAAGPTLGALGVPGTLADPRLSLVSGDAAAPGPFANDNWQQGNATAALFARVGAFPFSSGGLDAALAQTLPARGYTALVSGANGGTGLALVEAYDADATPGAPANPRLLNVATRGEVGAGANALIAGFVVSGTQPRRVLVRAVGPSLA
ncbi:MAG: hypothetical protein RLZZ15_2277, partial [Verrucomicrobiota bacterium]